MPQSLALTFFDDETCARVVRALRESGGDAATRELVRARLEQVRESLEQHFAIALGEPEEPQFLRYDAGDYFVAHQDGNTPLARDASLSRRVSVSIFLNAGYSGGSLVLHGGGNERTIVDAMTGMLVAFRSETTHEVTPVTDGERLAIVTWFPARETPAVANAEVPRVIGDEQRARAAATLPRVVEFIRSIGIDVREGAIERRTLVPGIDVDRGALIIEPARIAMAADLLHEAAHIALTTSSRRNDVDGTMDGTPAEEIGAIAWTWAAAVLLQLEPEDVFHEEVISGNGPTLLENFRNGCFVGVPFLQYHRLVAPGRYPEMLRWLRD